MRLLESIRSIDSKDITYSLVPVSLWAYVFLMSLMTVYTFR